MNKGYFKRVFYKIESMLNNIKIRRKLILLYIICVFIPVLITDYGFYVNAKNTINNERMINIERSLERISAQVNRYIGTCISLSDVLYSDMFLYEYLDDQYTDSIHYYEMYNSKLKNYMLKYITSYKQILNIELYADNDTIVNGNYFKSIDGNIKNTQWYREFSEMSNNLGGLYYYDNNRRILFSGAPLRTVSIIRKLDNFYAENPIERILKIDLDYSEVTRILTEEYMEEEVYITDGKKIIFSNNKTFFNGNEEFKDVFYENNNHVIFKENLDVPFKDWQIVILTKPVTIIEILKDLDMNLLLLIILNLVFPSLVILSVAKSFTKRLELINENVSKMKNEEFVKISVSDSKDELGLLIKQYNLMVVKIKKLIEVVYKEKIEKKSLELAKKEAELNALHSQINPHFLFNTLETIRMKSVIKKEKETADVIKNLSKLLRRSLSWGDDIITLKEEIDFVREYLKIQQYRFSDRLTYNIIVDDINYLQYKIPKLSVLTFVENSCVHGIEETEENGEISIKVGIIDEFISISVIDTGNGMEEYKLQEIKRKLNTCNLDYMNTSKSIGLLNVIFRLKMYYNNNIKVDIESRVNKGTTIILKIPKVK